MESGQGFDEAEERVRYYQKQVRELREYVLKEAEHLFTIGAFAIIVNAQQHVFLCHRRNMDR